MDAISCVGSIVQLLGVVVKTTEILYNLSQYLDSVPANLERLLATIETFRDLLTIVNERGRSFDKQNTDPTTFKLWSSLPGMIEAVLSPLKDDIYEVERLAKASKANGTGRIMRAKVAMWLKSAHIERYEKSLDSQTNILAVVLALTNNSNTDLLLHHTGKQSALLQGLDERTSSAQTQLECISRNLDDQRVLHQGFDEMKDTLKLFRSDSDITMQNFLAELRRIQQLASEEGKSAGFCSNKRASETMKRLEHPRTLPKFFNSMARLPNRFQTNFFVKEHSIWLPLGILSIESKQRHFRANRDPKLEDEMEYEFRFKFNCPRWLSNRTLSSWLRLRIPQEHPWELSWFLRPNFRNCHPAAIALCKTYDEHSKLTIDNFRRIIREGHVNVHSLMPNNKKLLEIAVPRDNPWPSGAGEPVDYLLNQGADPNDIGEEDHAILKVTWSRAMCEGKVKTVKHLLRCGLVPRIPWLFQLFDNGTEPFCYIQEIVLELTDLMMLDELGDKDRLIVGILLDINPRFRQLFQEKLFVSTPQYLVPVRQAVPATLPPELDWKCLSEAIEEPGVDTRVWLLDCLCSYGTTESIVSVMVALKYCGAHAPNTAVPSQRASQPQQWLLEKLPTSLAPRMLRSCIYGRNYDTFNFLWARGLRFENERETLGQIDRLLSERMSIAHIPELVFRTLQILSVLLESVSSHAHEGVNFLPWLILSCCAGHPRHDQQISELCQDLISKVFYRMQLRVSSATLEIPKEHLSLGFDRLKLMSGLFAELIYGTRQRQMFSYCMRLKKDVFEYPVSEGPCDDIVVLWLLGNLVHICPENAHDSLLKVSVHLGNLRLAKAIARREDEYMVSNAEAALTLARAQLEARHPRMQSFHAHDMIYELRSHNGSPPTFEEMKRSTKNKLSRLSISAEDDRQIHQFLTEFVNQQGKGKGIKISFNPLLTMVQPLEYLGHSFYKACVASQEIIGQIKRSHHQTNLLKWQKPYTNPFTLSYVDAILIHIGCIISVSYWLVLILKESRPRFRQILRDPSSIIRQEVLVILLVVLSTWLWQQGNGGLGISGGL